MAALWLPLHHQAFTVTSIVKLWRGQAGRCRLHQHTETRRPERQHPRQRAGPRCLTRMTSNLMPPEMEEALAPEQVTPAVVFMCSEQAPTGKIICAGVRSYAAAQIVETRGMYLGTAPSAEDVADNWEQISNSTIRPKPCSRAANKHAVSSN